MLAVSSFGPSSEHNDSAILKYAASQYLNACSLVCLTRNAMSRCQLKCERSFVSAWPQSYQSNALAEFADSMPACTKAHVVSANQEGLPWLLTVVLKSERSWKSLGQPGLPSAPRKEQGWCVRSLQSALPQTQPCVQSLLPEHHAAAVRIWSWNCAHNLSSCWHLVRQ